MKHAYVRWGVVGGLATLLSAAGLAAQERGAFVVTRGRDTLAVDRFERTATELKSTLQDRTSGARVALDLQLTPDALVTGGTIKAWGPTRPDTAPPDQSATLAFQGDTVVFTTPTGPHRFAVAAGALPYENLAGSILEQVIRRARAAHLATVPAFAFNGTPRPIGVSAGAGDSVTLTLGPGVQIVATADAAGRLLGATVPSQGVTVTRTTADVRLAPAPKPDYSAPAGAPYTAQDVTVPGPAGTLAGTLTLPRNARGRLPAVITITGSGPEDRDENIGAVAPGYRPFRQVADTLTRRGIAVLRMDDRGTGASGGQFRGATSEDFSRDIEAGIAWLRARPDIDPDRIGIVGHSEGGIIAPMIAARDPRLRAIAIMAGPAYTGRRILRFQVRYGLQRDSALSGARLDSAVERTMVRIDSSAASDPWIRLFLDYDPVATAHKVRTPVLILQGATDQQVTAEQAPLLEQAFKAAGNKDVTLKVFPEHNHLFLVDPTGNPANYPKLSGYLIDPGVMGTLADWMARELGAGAPGGRGRAASGRPGEPRR